MVESMEDGVVMTDADYRILVINPAAKRVIGKENQKEITIFDFIDNLGGKMDMRGRLEEA
jgi:PAS domain-containing protein